MAVYQWQNNQDQNDACIEMQKYYTQPVTETLETWNPYNQTLNQNSIDYVSDFQMNYIAQSGV